MVLILMWNLRQNSSIHSEWVKAMRAWELEMKESQTATKIEILDLQDIVSDDIAKRTEDRFKGKDHSAFLDALFEANPSLRRPEGW